jgi:hypothetical protein
VPIEAFKSIPPDENEPCQPKWDDAQLSFQLAQAVPDVQFRQILLMMRSERQRMRQLAEFLPEYAIRRANIEHVQRVAPRNGHAKHYLPLDRS